MWYNNFMKMYNTQNEKQKAFMVYVSFNTKEDVNTKISELKSLIQANNLDVVGNMVQFKKEDLNKCTKY